MQYINWQNESSNIFNLTNLKQNKNMQKTKHDDSDGDETLVIKSKHSELNIINTERTVISKNSNESQKKP